MIDRGRVYSVPEAWRETHVPRQALYDAVASGELRAVRRGRRWIIGGAALIRFLEELGR